MLPLVYPLITQNPAAFVAVGDRVYRHGTAPEGVADPYVTWFVPGGTPENTLGELPIADSYTVQVDVWSGGDQSAEDAAKAVRDAIEPFHTMASISTSEDPTTKRVRVSMTFTFWVDRA